MTSAARLARIAHDERPIRSKLQPHFLMVVNFVINMQARASEFALLTTASETRTMGCSRHEETSVVAPKRGLLIMNNVDAPCFTLGLTSGAHCRNGLGTGARM